MYVDASAAQVHIITTATRTRIVLALFEVANSKQTIIISHGNASDLGYMMPILSMISKQLQVNVVGYDYSGYGACTGTPTDRQTYIDIEDVFKWSLKRFFEPDHQFILYGQSVGSGPSCFLASHRRYANRIAGLILHSPIMSGLRVLTETRGILACFDIYPNINRMSNVRCNVYIMHGEVLCVFVASYSFYACLG